jgi:glycosyltransferase involved in cell wall biosynthesis
MSIINNYVNSGYVNYKNFTTKPYDTLIEHDVFVLPSFYNEGLPMSIMEAMATGMPIITTYNRGCNQTVQNEVNGYLINTNSIQELAISMEKLIINNEKISEFGKMSRKLAEKKFDQNLINDLIIKTIMNALN